jgi:hypothetical protein
MPVMIASLLVLAASSAPATAETPVLPGWLAGGWAMQSDDGSWSEEWWTPPRGGLMMGAGRSGKGKGFEWWEHTRIEASGGKVSFCALPKGQKGACFDATRASLSEIVFENPGHDFPTRVGYRREGDRLFAEISGPGGANPQRWTFTRIP